MDTSSITWTPRLANKPKNCKSATNIVNDRSGTASKARQADRYVPCVWSVVVAELEHHLKHQINVLIKFWLLLMDPKEHISLFLLFDI